jgi:hypothetical protein
MMPIATNKRKADPTTMRVISCEKISIKGCPQSQGHLKIGEHYELPIIDGCKKCFASNIQEKKSIFL